jgi:hypothetical protein
MFKSRRNPYYRKRNQGSPKRILIWTPIIIIVAFIVLELLVRLLVGITGYSEELAAYQGQTPLVDAYRLQFLSSQQEPLDGLPQGGDLLATESVGVGYELVGDRATDFWSLNPEGFRDDDPLPLNKPADEFRIFLLGNSTAFGYWTEGNQATITHYLEERINERVAQQQNSPERYRPDVFPFFEPSREDLYPLPPKIQEGNYRVINAAVPGYVSGNELAQFVLQILPYKPDLVVVLDGYTDLTLPSLYSATPIPQVDKFLTDAPQHFWVYLTRPIQNWFANTYLAKATQYWVLKPELSIAQKTLTLPSDANSLVNYLPDDEEELAKRLERYYQNHLQLVRICAGFSLPLVVGVQPEITGRGENLTPVESQLVSELGQDYVQRIQTSYQQLVEANRQLESAYPNNVKTLNLYEFFNDFPETTFSDAIHLTEAANQELAIQLYTTITNLPGIQIIPKNFNL